MEKYGGEMSTKPGNKNSLKEKFRISKCNFDHILSIIRPIIDKNTYQSSV